MKSPRLRQTVFRLKISSFLAFSTFEKGFLWHSRWGGGVTRANFCITRGSLSWLVAPRDAKIGTRDTTPSPLVPQKALFKGLEGPKDWFSAEKQFALPQTFHVVLTNIIKYYFLSNCKKCQWGKIPCTLDFEDHCVPQDISATLFEIVLPPLLCYHTVKKIHI